VVLHALPATGSSVWHLVAGAAIAPRAEPAIVLSRRDPQKAKGPASLGGAGPVWSIV